MTVNNKKKYTRKTVLITLLLLVVAVGVIIGGIFGLRAIWKLQMINRFSLPSPENGITLKLREYGVSDGEKYSHERVIRYNSSCQGLWFDMTYGSSQVFAYGDMAYRATDNNDEYWEIYECFDSEKLQSQLGDTGFINSGMLDDIYDIVLDNLAEAVDGAWKWGSNYYVTLDKDYLIEKKFDNMRKESGLGNWSNKYRGIKCVMTINGGMLRSLRISYRHYWKNDSDRFEVRNSENYIDLELEQGADFSAITLPKTFERSLSQMQGNLLKSSTTYEGEYADCAYVTPDDAVNIYVHDAGESRNEYVSVYAQDGVMTVTTDYGVEIYSLPELKKLRKFEFYTKIVGCDVADGRLAVVVSGIPDTGSGELNTIMPAMSWVYIYDLETFTETGRYDISSVLPGGIDFGLDEVTDAVVYDGECVCVRFDGKIHKLDLSTGQISRADSMPSSLNGTDGGGLIFVPYTPEAGEGYYYPEPIYFYSPEYAGFSFEGYDLVEFRSGKDYGLFDRGKGEFVYIFPRAVTFSSEHYFVCSLGGGKYLCHIGLCLFTIDFSRLQTHSYEYATSIG